MEDGKIIELLFARSEQALSELDRKYGKLLLSIAQGILNDPADAEECVNDAYLGAWNKIPPERPDPLPAYLCKIVRNLSLKRYAHKDAAKRSSAYQIAMEELESCLPAPDTVEAELHVRELTRMIQEFLDSLSEENAVIFLRRYWFSDSYREIARRVGLTEKTVSVRLTRMRRQLKDYLCEREVFV